MLRKLSLLYNSVRYLKPMQLAFFILRRVFLFGTNACLPIAARNELSVNDTLILHSPTPSPVIVSQQHTFCFLNQRKDYRDDIDWSATALPRLWGYNLHYFDYLRQSDLDVSRKLAFVVDWIEQNPQAAQPGWEPFTTSLRIVNWVFFFVAHPEHMNAKVRESLYLQTLWLEKNDERHILANHYFENLKALLFAGAYFCGTDAQRWRRRATSELIEQLAEQTLPDGGHYERSPQYHSLMLENYLDIFNLAKHYAGIKEDALGDENWAELLSAVNSSATLALGHLNRIVFPDKKIPLFNDSAFDIAPTVDELNGYAKVLCGYLPPKATARAIIEEGDTGLYGLRSGNNMLLMDCGDIGPSYQPGHTHCDFLSYELMISGRRLVVDTGVSEYEPGDRRHYVRSTAAHNTISVDGLEQSEIWGAFRVGRRARKVAAKVSPLRNDTFTMQGSYEGFFDGGWLNRPRFRHNRQINVKLVKEGFECIEVIDTIDAIRGCDSKLNHSVSSFVHLHPDVSLAQSSAEVGASEGLLTLNLDGQQVGTIQFGRECDARLGTAVYCPQFGVQQEAPFIEFQYQGQLPVTLRYVFSLSVENNNKP